MTGVIAVGALPMPGADVDRAANAVQIEVARVDKSFDHARERVHALAGCTFTVDRGEFVSLIGPSGCGKSTLLRLVGGLMEPDDGSVVVDGQPPRKLRSQKYFGFVPQTPALMPWLTVQRNVQLLRKVNRGADRRSRRDGRTIEPVDAEALLHAVGLGNFLHSLPKELSGGMQQRVGLVRAFSLGAPILLMDEPFAALDEITRSSMRYHLLDVWERTRKTVLFVTHSISEAVMLSDRVLVLASRPGRVTRDIAVDLPRPRQETMEDSTEFLEVVREIKAALREGWLGR
jgi:NitT/TauT family transport system ATP-binding protein